MVDGDGCGREDICFCCVLRVRYYYDDEKGNAPVAMEKKRKGVQYYSISHQLQTNNTRFDGIRVAVLLTMKGVLLGIV